MITVFKKNVRKYLLLKDKQNFKKEFCRKAIVSYPPRWITIGITNRCTNRCVFCSYHSEDAKTSSNVYNLPYSLTLPDFQKIVDMAYKGRVPHIHICGTGEPFMNKNVLDMLDYTIHVYGKTSIQTNFCKHIFDKHNYLEEILKRKKNISYITTDIMSGDPQQHNELKKGSDYKDVIDSIEYIARNSKINVKVHLLLTQLNYETINNIIDDISNREISNCSLNIVNLYSYDFNKYTASDMVYTSSDIDISKTLQQAAAYGKRKNIPVSVPQPADLTTDICNVFWTKIQTWPVKGNLPERYHENLIPHACRAVVNGELNSLGYIFDYENVMDFWNNEKIVSIRESLLKGIYPSGECRYCYSCNSKDGVFKQKNSWKKSIEKQLIDFEGSAMVKSLNKDSICIDCGANVGRITEIMAKKGASVYAFEPNPSAYNELSIKFKDADNVVCIQKGVLDRNTRRKLFLYQYNKEDPLFWSMGASIYDTKDDVDKSQYVEAEFIDIVVFIKELNRPIDILKIDIEGSEYDVLLKLIEQGLYNNIKHILVETHDRHIPEIKEKGSIIREKILKNNITNIDLQWV